MFCNLNFHFIPNPPDGAVQQIRYKKLYRDREHIQLIVIGSTLPQLINTAPYGEKEKSHPKYCLPCVKTREDAK